MALWVTAIAAVVAAAVGTYGAVETSQHQQEVADYNKKVARNQAQAQRDAAAAAEESARERDRRLMASQRAKVGASGVTTEGSPLAVLLDSAEQSEIEALRLRYGGKLQATGSEADAGLQKYYGQRARSTGAVNAGTTLLTGASSASSASYKAYAAGR